VRWLVQYALDGCLARTLPTLAARLLKEGRESLALLLQWRELALIDLLGETVGLGPECDYATDWDSNYAAARVEASSAVEVARAKESPPPQPAAHLKQDAEAAVQYLTALRRVMQRGREEQTATATTADGSTVYSFEQRRGGDGELAVLRAVAVVAVVVRAGGLCSGSDREEKEAAAAAAAAGTAWWVTQRRTLRAAVVATAVSTLGELPQAQFNSSLRELYPAMAQLMCHDHPAVRRAVSRVCSTRVHALLLP
jgi:hypothetical protein